VNDRLDGLQIVSSKTASVSSPTAQRWRRPGWKILVVVFAGLPLAAVWLVEPLLFFVVGNGHYIPADSAGFGLVRWWNAGAGQMMTAGVVALAVLLLRRVFPPLALGLAAVAGAATVAWWIVSVFVYVLMTGTSLD